jgi:hypothetical protein
VLLLFFSIYLFIFIYINSLHFNYHLLYLFVSYCAGQGGASPSAGVGSARGGAAGASGPLDHTWRRR